MIKYLFLITLVLGLSTLSNAQQQITIGKNVQSLTELTASISNLDQSSVKETFPNASTKKTAKNMGPFKEHPVAYILGGALLVVIIIFYVITGGQGWSSR